MRRDLKNNVFQDYFNSDADCSFASAAAWNAGRRIIDFRAANQYVDRILVNVVVVAAGTTVTFHYQGSEDRATWVNVVPYRDADAAANWAAITATGHYMAEYRNIQRYGRLCVAAQTGTFVLFAWATGMSKRNPVNRAGITMAT